MIVVTKDKKEYLPLLIGSLDSEEPGEFITCIEAGDSPSRDMFGQVTHFKIHISEVKGFKGTYAFPPDIYGKK